MRVKTETLRRHPWLARLWRWAHRKEIIMCLWCDAHGTTCMDGVFGECPVKYGYPDE